MHEFESSRLSQPVWVLENITVSILKGTLMAGFWRQVRSPAVQVQNF